MTALQKTIKYLAMFFAIFLTVSIIGGILGAVGLIGGLFESDAVTEDLKTYTVSSDIKSLIIEINAAELTVKRGDVFLVESNLKHLTVKDNNGVLTVKETERFSRTYRGAVLTVYLPENTVFNNAELTTGAGRLKINSLSADKLRLELGAGEAVIDSLTAVSDADIVGGAGRISISDGLLHDLDLDMGVGQLELVAELSGESEFDLGVGESNITLVGTEQDYSLDVEKGLGSITLDGEKLSNTKKLGNGESRVEINGGVGDINIKFE